MKTKFIEATTSTFFGKFMVGRFEAHEWAHQSAVDRDLPLLRLLGWGQEHLMVFDVQTGEGAIFAVRPNGHPGYDLNKHKIHVCLMFEPFLEWLYQQDVSDLDALPDLVEFPDDAATWAGRRGQKAV